MIYKLKTEEAANTEFYFDDTDGYYPSEDKKKNGKKVNDYVQYISRTSMGTIVTNESKYYLKGGLFQYCSFTDAEFKHVFGWATELEISKEEHPEYWL